MIRRGSFVGDFLGSSNPVKKTASKKSQEPRWFIVETEGGEKILAKRDEKENEKTASKYQDFDDYVSLIYPKEYAKKYIEDPNSHKLDIDRAGKFFGNFLRTKISNLQTLEDSDLKDVSRKVFSAVDSAEIAETAKQEGYLDSEDEKIEAGEKFSQAFIQTIRNSSTNSFKDLLTKKISSVVTTSTNPYRKIEELVSAGVEKNILINLAKELNNSQKISNQDLDSKILKAYLESKNNPDLEQYKEGYKVGILGRKSNLDSSTPEWIRGYITGLEESYEFEDR